jgi:type I restriction enzyme M protein
LKEPNFASDCSTIETKDENELNIKFLYHSLKSRQEDFYKFQIGGAQPHVYATHFANFKIPLPPLSIQQEIVAELSIMKK